MKTSRINELEKAIIYHKEKYYTGKAEVSDEKYDLLEEELKNLDPKNPVLSIVGFKQNDTVGKVEHQKKMLSLDKTYSTDDLNKWVEKNEALSIFKIDGSSCSLVYENGRLSMAKTRGDGSFGENITQKAILIPEIPKSVKGLESFEVRGEVYCIESKFIQLSAEMKALGLDTPMSQRNIVAGLLGRKENIQLCSFLSFKAFDLISDKKFSKEHQKLETLKELGFETPDYEIHKNKKSIEERIKEAKSFMTNGDYLIDGLVFVYDDLKTHDELGETSHHPRYKIAFKFAGDTKITRINDIEWGVSRNGKLTPVALVDPVELSGAMIGRVTLHNFGMAKNFELKAGDKIEIIRSGEVIPKFLGVAEKALGEFKYPTRCPSCEQGLKVEDIWLYCVNDNCPAKVKEEILNYIQKAGIDDLSDKRLDELLSKKLVKNIPDLYRLTMEDFLSLDKVKEKLATKMFENINKTKTQTLVQFISAIGVEGVSTAKSEKIISQGYNTIEKILSLTPEKMMEIEGFAEKSSNEIVSGIQKREKLIRELLNLGINLETSEIHTGEGPLAGKKFCITGELSMARAEFEKIIKKNGGVIVSSVSKNTNYLVTNEKDSSSSKFVKAKSLGIPVVNEKQIIKMIES